jgi:hypothetical protein
MKVRVFVGEEIETPEGFKFEETLQIRLGKKDYFVRVVDGWFLTVLEKNDSI